MSHADHLFPEHNENPESGKLVFVLMIDAQDKLYIPAGLAGHHPFESIHATLDIGEAARLPGHPASPFDPDDEILLVTDDTENAREFLVDSKHVAHYRECPDCEGIWSAREAAYNSLDEADKATSSFFAITETNRGPYLVHAADLEPTGN